MSSENNKGKQEEYRKPKVKLISHTENPVETIAAIWRASREEDSLIVPARDWSVAKRAQEDDVALFVKVIESAIPVGENVSFTFLLENISISLREQMVRHRIGVKVGDRIGCDIAPDLADSTWWSQSSRVINMSNFASKKKYHVAESILGNPEAEKLYVELMEEIEAVYWRLVALGIPREDARDVLPLALQHRVTWTLNLCSLKHIIGKRSCWILQAGIWGTIIKQMVDELALRIHPVFRNLINPPCIKNGKFESCSFNLDNEKRTTGEDPLPPCSLWMNLCRKNFLKASAEGFKKGLDCWRPVEKLEGVVVGEHRNARNMEKFLSMQKQYSELWQRDPITGDSISKGELEDGKI